MKVLVITSCTSQKRIASDRLINSSDLKPDGEYSEPTRSGRPGRCLPAEELYTGQQHVRLMRGVSSARTTPNVSVDLWIISAGYGMVDGARLLAPYDETFSGQPKSQIRERAVELDIPRQFREVIGGKYELAVILLGADYADAISLTPDVHFASPTLFLCSKSTASLIQTVPNVVPVVVTREHAKVFGCGLVGLKGELASRILVDISENEEAIGKFIEPHADVVSLLRHEPIESYATTITLDKNWKHESANRRLKFFIPDWDDLVDPGYDFVTDTHSSGAADWTNEVFAHEIYERPNYDGILVSRVVLEKSASKRNRIEQLGIHRYLRVPDEFSVMGDCGAFGYVSEDVPPYSTSDVLDYYTHHGFNMGVSVDHLIIPGIGDKRQDRYNLTISNAEEFLNEHRAQQLPWEPIGAIQGWDAESYATAARQVASMGYRYVALGGLVRSTTASILGIVEAVHANIPSDVKVHLFGLARLQAMRAFTELGVHSVDSASPLRRAWMDSKHNYLTDDGWYTAIRIQDSQRSRTARLKVQRGEVKNENLHALETRCLRGLRAYGERSSQLTPNLIASIAEYESLLGNASANRYEEIRRTLEDRPWEACNCRICRDIGIDVILFRGNNRNRRRGFHNTYVFYRLMDRVVQGEHIPWIPPAAPIQRNLI